MQSVVLRLHVVCLSVTLVGQEPHRLEILETISARTISPTSSLFAAQRPSTYSQWNMGNFGEIRGGVGKSGVQSGTKAAICLKRVKIVEKLLCRAYTNSPTLFRTLDPLLPPHPQDWGSQPQPKTVIVIISGTGTDCKFGRYIHRVHPNKSPL